MTTHYETENPETIERDIESTRARIDNRLNSLQDNAGQAAGQAYAYARENGAAIASSIGRTVRDHPLPCLLTAAGVTWLLLSTRTSTPNGNGTLHKAGEKMSAAGTSARDAASRARDKAGEARAKAGEYGVAAKEKGSQAVSAAGDFAQEHPLAVGAIGLALGAVIGAALSPTSREDRYFGEKADEAKDYLKETAQRKAEEAREVAEAAIDAGLQRGKEEAKETTTASKSDAASSAKPKTAKKSS